MSLLNDETPIEKHRVGRRVIHVKREDLCTPVPGPPFSKMRGLLPKLKKLKADGYEVVAYVETAVSMAGWGVAWLAPKVGLDVIIFDPQYAPRKRLPPHLRLLEYHRYQWKIHGATLIPLQAHMAAVNYHRAKKWLGNNCAKPTYLLPLGLPLEESVAATADVARALPQSYKNVVINVGSGTICAGVLRGLKYSPVTIWGIMGRTGDAEAKALTIETKAGILEEGLLKTRAKLNIVDPGYEYARQESQVEAPFPCHPFYDLKAWRWLVDNLNNLKGPVLFWNIGA